MYIISRNSPKADSRIQSGLRIVHRTSTAPGRPKRRESALQNPQGAHTGAPRGPEGVKGAHGG